MENEQIKLIDVIEEMCSEKDVCLKPMRVAEDIMNADVKTLTLDHTVKHCLKYMEGHRIRHVAVVDLPNEGEKKPYFIGIVSQRDVLRLSARDTEETGKQKIEQRALRQLLVNIVARKPRSVSLQTPVQDVIMVMICNHIDMVPVLDDADLVGFITTTDLMKIFFRLDKAIHRLFPEFKKGAPPVDTASESSAKARILFSWVFRAVQEIMTEQVICLEPQDDLARAIEVMQTKKFRHVPIIDEQGKFVGLVSDRDILRNLPYAGRRPPLPPKKFREHLFATDSWTENLQQPLDSIMVRKVSHISPRCSVCKAVDTMYRKKISCLPVVDKREKLLGIVTVTDLMRVLLSAYEPAEKAGLIPSESSLCKLSG
ncbi:MAG: CBS domain-containing protein [Planctomycetes bacterium]|nr:CBS domain-containing protein [Planctomycetota bacterium]